MNRTRWILVLGLFVLSAPLFAQQKEVIPHHQDKPPGPALSPQEAIAKMTVPEGFKVELVASEPDIVNPVAMTIDERGRFWITESFEYPRKSPGPGKDRVKILEDTDGDGRADKFTVFAEGLNIPSGIAVGHGGVWVANSPDILFMQDTDGDGRADKQEVVVTGFGRTDTHELPNSLTWGPDGWLYGLNGVFNFSHVFYPKSSPHYREDHPGWKFTCAMFRIHPRTREFQIFAEGTSNPWGIAFNEDGEAFISACVIDHLWHITETGYYHRQGGPYPPHTWKIESIVKHKHQKAAYCGITWFDSDAYPEQYRGLLYMGNIHGGCINVDRLKRDGSTYFATPEPDFLTANDAWFMPVVQKTGPDGSLYILDWYDRYHCYQDANRDPAGIDRLKGRLYRVRYKETPRVSGFDLAKESDEQLIKRLGHPNVYFRDIAQRILTERLAARKDPSALRERLLTIARDTFPALPPLPTFFGKPEPVEPHDHEKAKMHALWVVIGAGQLDEAAAFWSFFSAPAFGSRPAAMEPWVVRAIGNQRGGGPDDQVRMWRNELRKSLLEGLANESPQVRLQFAIAASKLQPEKNPTPVDFKWDPLAVLVRALATAGDDKLIPHIVWNNLQPLLEDRASNFLALAKKENLAAAPGFQRMTPYLVDRLAARRDKDPQPIAALLALLVEGETLQEDAARRSIDAVAQRVQSGEIGGAALADLKKALAPTLEKLVTNSQGPLFLDAAMLAASLGDSQGIVAVRGVFASSEQTTDRRVRALDALIAAADPDVLESVTKVLGDARASVALRGSVIASLGRLDDDRVGETVLAHYPRLEPDVKPKAIELLTQRAAWTRQLLARIEKKEIAPDALNVNQVRKLLASKDADLVKQVTAVWGTVRTERNPQREEVIARMRTFLRQNPGDPHKGIAVYNKVCGQCHKLHGQGQEVGPDITLNGRSSFEQLLSNVFDPSLVIGASYQARTVATKDGRILTGLLVEDNAQRVVLKVQGGKLETMARDHVDEMEVSKLSMMPEDLEKQLKPEELADLFAYITLDKPPTDPTAKQLPGVRALPPQETSDPARFGELVTQVLPGFTTTASGEQGVAILTEHQGRVNVLRTHPVNQTKPCVLTSKVEIPADRKARLVLAVSHDARGDWQLMVRAGGKKLHESLIGPKTTTDGWAEITVDLSEFAGQRIELELVNQANNWSYEHAYWGRAEVVIDQ
jgi:putative membrane-bound dehydrogenase-like protein